MQVYIDGKWYPKEEAKVSVFDHGFLYGDGVFEGIRAYNGRVWKLTEHLDRLYASAKAIWLQMPISWSEMEEVVLESLRRNNLKDAYIRLVISRGYGDLGLDPRKCEKPTVVCIADKISLYPEAVYTEGMKVISVATRRNPVDTLSPQIKTLNYMTGIMAKISAITLGYPEVIMLNQNGYVTEGTGDNIFMVKNGKIITPPAYLGILPGITRNSVIEMARDLGYTVEEGVFTLFDVYTADELFLTGTAAEVIPVVSADSREIGNGRPGEITGRLIARFRELTKEQGTPINR
ncbi:MAG TPA: branched-chain-amino-acid transaminase [Symbiobacteriaceae bacterium]|jgi:branched-chain amino acid aminotransferase|nr:branched-chain-amino-acid transaminase [Symbiobacteriaceae bacterium]